MRSGVIDARWRNREPHSLGLMLEMHVRANVIRFELNIIQGCLAFARSRSPQWSLP